MTDPASVDAAAFAALSRRLSIKIEQRKPMQLSKADLDMLVISGAYAVFSQYAVAHLDSLVRDDIARERVRDDNRD